MKWAALLLACWLAFRLRRKLLARDVDHTARCWGTVRARDLQEATAVFGRRAARRIGAMSRVSCVR